MTRPVKEDTVKISLPIRSAIHAEMTIRAKEDRRSLINLINLVMEQYLQNLKNAETVEAWRKEKGGENE